MAYDLSTLQARFLHHHHVLGRSPKTISHYRDPFALFDRFGGTLSSASLAAFATWLRNTPTRGWRGSIHRSKFGVFGALKDMKAFLRWCTEEGLITHQVKVPVPKLPQTLFPILTDDEIARVWRSEHLSFPGDLGKRNRALIALMFDTGLRRGEAVGLTVSDSDLDNQLVTVTGKGRKQRRVPFSTSVAELLHEWIVARGEAEGPLFLLQAAGLRQLFRRIQAETGIKEFFPHQVRHTSATHMVRANMDLHSVKRVLGHNHIWVTEKYLSLSDTDLREKHAAASPFERLRMNVTPLPTRLKRLSRT